MFQDSVCNNLNQPPIQSSHFPSFVPTNLKSGKEFDINSKKLNHSNVHRPQHSPQKKPAAVKVNFAQLTMTEIKPSPFVNGLKQRPQSVPAGVGRKRAMSMAELKKHAEPEVPPFKEDSDIHNNSMTRSFTVGDLTRPAVLYFYFKDHFFKNLTDANMIKIASKIFSLHRFRLNTC